jgi:N-acetylglucosamine-6-phosphate deacetylase
MDVTVGVDGVRLADGTLAGAALGLDGAVRNLLAYTGCTISEAAATVTSTPASVLRLADRGVIDDGRRADLVVLTPELDIVATIVAGEVVFAAQDLRWRS